MARSRLMACDIQSTWSSAPRDFSNSSALRSISSICALATDHDQGNRRLRGVEGLAFLVVRLPRLQFFGRLPIVAAEFGEQRDHGGVDAGHQDVGFLALVVAYQRPARAAGDSAYSVAPLVED